MTYFPYLHGEHFSKALWSYLFDSEWSDNLDAALQRIQNVLDGKVTSEIKISEVSNLIQQDNIDNVKP